MSDKMIINKQNILIGSGVILGFAILYNSYQKRRKDIPVYFKKSLLKNYNARTIPPFGIYVKENQRDNEALINHEKVHWKQYQNKGLVNFYLQYLQQLKSYGYDKMPMEQQARGNETQYCKENYTECVRTGKSNTVYNPNFRI